jgi:hypothetical protein
MRQRSADKKDCSGTKRVDAICLIVSQANPVHAHPLTPISFALLLSQLLLLLLLLGSWFWFWFWFWFRLWLWFRLRNRIVLGV